jgi:hypothetical protein
VADFKIDLTGYPVPAEDGEVNTYTNREAAAQPEYFSATRKAIFVNGMANTGQAHVESAVILSLVQMSPVVGLYNKTSGFVADLTQCLGDKNQFNGPLSFSAQNKARMGTLLSPKTSEAVIVQALSRNPAQVPLFHLLRRPEYKTSEIFAHSQGNLILSNALQGIAAVDGPQAIAGRVVHTFGSPAVNWPKGITKLEHGFTFDPVNWLSGFDTSFSISKVGMPSGSLNPITHGFLEYLKKDPAFVVNRFRVGSWGMTFKMDEDGLAACLAAMGPNMPRVRAIFAHLDAHHNSDADDVAVRYVKLIRGAPPTAKALATDKDLVRRLIKVLDEGWTDDEEKRAIGWLKAL